MNEIILGSCPEVLSQFCDNYVDLIVTSPPYDDLRAYKGIHSFDFTGTATELYRILKPGGVLVWIVADATHKGSETLTSFRQAIHFTEKTGFRMHDTMIYAKKNPMPKTHNRYEQEFEYTFVLSKGKPKTFNPIMVPVSDFGKIRQDEHHQRHHHRGNKKRGHRQEKIKGNIWYYKIGFGQTTSDKEAFAHPALFPEQLASDHIMSWSNAGDLVLDPFCGAGTTCKMTYVLGRKYIGIDCAKEYVDLAKKRLDKLTASE